MTTVSCFVLPPAIGGAADAPAGLRDQSWAGEVEIATLHGPLDFALQRALGETSGDLIAFAAPGDAWLPEKLRLQVAALEAAPQAGGAHADIQPLGPGGELERASWFAASKLDGATGLGGVLSGRQPWLSTVVLRRELVERLVPLPAVAEPFDTYLAARATELAELAFVPVPLARVRMQGVAQARGHFVPQLELVRREIALLRWSLGALVLDSLSAADLADVRGHLDALVACAAELSGTYRDASVAVAHAHRVNWRRAMARAGAERASGRPVAAAAAYLAAGAADPFERHAREQLAAVLEPAR
jgi:hypothetical protein